MLPTAPLCCDVVEVAAEALLLSFGQWLACTTKKTTRKQRRGRSKILCRVRRVFVVEVAVGGKRRSCGNTPTQPLSAVDLRAPCKQKRLSRLEMARNAPSPASHCTFRVPGHTSLVVNSPITGSFTTLCAHAPFQHTIHLQAYSGVQDSHWHTAHALSKSHGDMLLSCLWTLPCS